RFTRELGVDGLALFPVENIGDLFGRQFPAQEVRVHPRQVHALLARDGQDLSDARARLEIAGVVDVLQNLFAAVAADALAVLAVDFPAPASEEAFALGCLAAQTENTAVIIDLLAVVGMVGDGGGADEVDARPSRSPDCARTIEV